MQDRSTPNGTSLKWQVTITWFDAVHLLQF